MPIDREVRDQLRVADRLRLEAERLMRDFDTAVDTASRRYHEDVEFHAQVHQLARVIDADPEFTEVHQGEPQWEHALVLALKAVTALDEMKPGGLLDLRAVN